MSATCTEVDTGPVGERTESAQARAQVLEERRDEQDRLRGELDGAGRAPLDPWRHGGRTRWTRPSKCWSGSSTPTAMSSSSRSANWVSTRTFPAAVSARDAAALESHVAELDRQAAEICRAASEHSQAASATARASRARLSAMGERLGGDVDVQDIEVVVAAARARAEDARFGERRARESAEHFAAIVDNVRPPARAAPGDPGQGTGAG